MAESSQNRLKTLWGKEKLLDTSNFSFPTAFSTDFQELETRKTRACLEGKGFKKKVTHTFTPTHLST